MSRIVTVLAHPRNPVTGAIVPVRLAGGAGGIPYYFDDEHWQAGILQEPRFSAQLGFDQSGWTRGVIPTATAISFMPGRTSVLDQLAGLFWPGAALVVERRVPSAAPVRRLTGAVADATISDGVLVMQVADLSAKLSTPFITGYFTGEGGIEGASTAAGRIKRRSFGRVFDIEGRILDPATNVYEFGDPAFPLQGCVALRDKGRGGALGILGWQGSIAATLAALKASVPVAGGGVFAPSIACAKWWTKPAGPLCADLLGEIGTGYVDTAPAIAAAVLAAKTGPVITNLAAASTDQPAPAGLHFGTDSETTAGALDRLLGGVSLLWRLLPDGTVDLLPWSFTGDAEALNLLFLSRDRTLAPTGTRRVIYRRNEREHGDGDIAADLSASDVVYEDGTTAEALKPAEPAATSGAPENTYVAGRLAQLVNSLTDINAVNIIEQALRQDDAQRVLDARTFVDGQPVNTVFVTFRNEQVAANSALASTLALLGAKTPDGTGWVLDLATVQIGGGQTIAQKFTEIGAADASNSASVSALQEVVLGPTGQEARALVKARVNDNVATLVVGATGSESVIGFQADNTVIMSADGETVLATFGEDADGAYIPNLRVDRISIGAMDPEFTSLQGSSASQGSQELPGGIIMKWGEFRAIINNETQLSIVFDEPFPNACQSFVPTGFIDVFSAYRDLWPQNVGPKTRFGVTVGTQSSTSNDHRLDGFDWIAFGK
ncbi:gp53-like domain-containing protein [Sphingobium aquiterrae]|uniref:gp53-like domain-containing protein n=1 Tax=Sphingobium aquiterrae TaxID=2038656 RepID=UPI00301AE4DA